MVGGLAQIKDREVDMVGSKGRGKTLDSIAEPQYDPESLRDLALGI
jgi:hypothetical protein